MRRPSTVTMEDLLKGRLATPTDQVLFDHAPACITGSATITTMTPWVITSDCPYCGEHHVELWRWSPPHTRVNCRQCGNPYVTDPQGIWPE